MPRRCLLRAEKRVRVTDETFSKWRLQRDSLGFQYDDEYAQYLLRVGESLQKMNMLDQKEGAGGSTTADVGLESSRNEDEPRDANSPTELETDDMSQSGDETNSDNDNHESPEVTQTSIKAFKRTLAPPREGKNNDNSYSARKLDLGWCTAEYDRQQVLSGITDQRRFVAHLLNSHNQWCSTCRTSAATLTASSMAQEKSDFAASNPELKIPTSWESKKWFEDLNAHSNMSITSFLLHLLLIYSHWHSIPLPGEKRRLYADSNAVPPDAGKKKRKTEKRFAAWRRTVGPLKSLDSATSREVRLENEERNMLPGPVVQRGCVVKVEHQILEEITDHMVQPGQEVFDVELQEKTQPGYLSKDDVQVQPLTEPFAPRDHLVKEKHQFVKEVTEHVAEPGQEALDVDLQEEQARYLPEGNIQVHSLPEPVHGDYRVKVEPQSAPDEDPECMSQHGSSAQGDCIQKGEKGIAESDSRLLLGPESGEQLGNHTQHTQSEMEVDSQLLPIHELVDEHLPMERSVSVAKPDIQSQPVTVMDYVQEQSESVEGSKLGKHQVFGGLEESHGSVGDAVVVAGEEGVGHVSGGAEQTGRELNSEDLSEDSSSSNGDATSDSEFDNSDEHADEDVEASGISDVETDDELESTASFEMSDSDGYVDDVGNDPDWGDNSEVCSDVDDWSDDDDKAQKTVFCSLCGELKRSQHVRRHRSALSCKYCNFKLLDESVRKDPRQCVVVMREHRRENHPEHFQKYLCEECGKGYASGTGLKEHYNVVHNRGQGIRKCRECGDIFESMSQLTQHILKTHPKEVRCTFVGCEKVYSTKTSLRSHVKRIHLKEKKYVCTYEGCSRKFFARKKLQGHIEQTHMQLRKFQCDVCAKEFLNAYTLKIHQRIHSDEKPLKCPHCDYSARQRNAMNWHMKKQHAGPDAEEEGSSNDTGEGVRKRKRGKDAKSDPADNASTSKDEEPKAKRRSGRKSEKSGLVEVTETAENKPKRKRGGKNVKALE